MINRTPFAFFRGDLRLAGQLFRNTDRLDVRQPAVIVTGSWLTVKEQMPELYETPTLFVHSDDCVFPDHVRRVHGRPHGPKKLVWAAGTQTDFYDQPEQVDVAVDAADAFLSGKE